MHEPELYHKLSQEFKDDSGRLIKKYLKNFQWHNDGSDILVDVGSGPGDVFINYIRPQMPHNFRKAILSDISPEMLEYSKKYYQSPEKCEYRVLDISTKEELPIDIKGKVHHLTSINAMHWIDDYETALKNMYDLISPDGGDCFIIFMPYITTLDVNKYIVKSSKWSHYIKDAKDYIPITNHSDDVADNFRQMMQKAGFSQISIEETTNTINVPTFKAYKESVRPVCSMLNCIPESRREEFLDDIAIMIMELFLKEQDTKEIEFKYGVRYKFISVHAKKLPIEDGKRGMK